MPCWVCTHAALLLSLSLSPINFLHATIVCPWSTPGSPRLLIVYSMSFPMPMTNIWLLPSGSELFCVSAGSARCPPRVCLRSTPYRLPTCFWSCSCCASSIPFTKKHHGLALSTTVHRWPAFDDKRNMQGTIMNRHNYSKLITKAKCDNKNVRKV